MAARKRGLGAEDRESNFEQERKKEKVQVFKEMKWNPPDPTKPDNIGYQPCRFIKEWPEFPKGWTELDMREWLQLKHHEFMKERNNFYKYPGMFAWKSKVHVSTAASAKMMVEAIRNDRVFPNICAMDVEGCNNEIAIANWVFENPSEISSEDFANASRIKATARLITFATGSGVVYIVDCWKLKEMPKVIIEMMNDISINVFTFSFRNDYLMIQNRYGPKSDKNWADLPYSDWIFGNAPAIVDIEAYMSGMGKTYTRLEGEVDAIERFLDLSNANSYGLKGYLQQLTGIRLDKRCQGTGMFWDLSMDMSNEIPIDRKLSDQQLFYAMYDAWATMLVGVALARMSFFWDYKSIVYIGRHTRKWWDRKTVYYTNLQSIPLLELPTEADNDCTIVGQWWMPEFKRREHEEQDPSWKYRGYSTKKYPHFTADREFIYRLPEYLQPPLYIFTEKYLESKFETYLGERIPTSKLGRWMWIRTGRRDGKKILANTTTQPKDEILGLEIPTSSLNTGEVISDPQLKANSGVDTLHQVDQNISNRINPIEATYVEVEKEIQDWKKPQKCMVVYQSEFPYKMMVPDTEENREQFVTRQPSISSIGSSRGRSRGHSMSQTSRDRSQASVRSVVSKASTTRSRTSRSISPGPEIQINVTEEERDTEDVMEVDQESDASEKAIPIDDNEIAGVNLEEPGEESAWTTKRAYQVPTERVFPELYNYEGLGPKVTIYVADRVVLSPPADEIDSVIKRIDYDWTDDKQKRDEGTSNVVDIMPNYMKRREKGDHLNMVNFILGLRNSSNAWRPIPFLTPDCKISQHRFRTIADRKHAEASAYAVTRFWSRWCHAGLTRAEYKSDWDETLFIMFWRIAHMHYQIYNARMENIDYLRMALEYMRRIIDNYVYYGSGVVVKRIRREKKEEKVPLNLDKVPESRATKNASSKLKRLFEDLNRQMQKEWKTPKSRQEKSPEFQRQSRKRSSWHELKTMGTHKFQDLRDKLPSNRSVSKVAREAKEEKLKKREEGQSTSGFQHRQRSTSQRGETRHEVKRLEEKRQEEYRHEEERSDARETIARHRREEAEREKKREKERRERHHGH